MDETGLYTGEHGKTVKQNSSLRRKGIDLTQSTC
jgi:hypothetical protein